MKNKIIIIFTILIVFFASCQKNRNFEHNNTDDESETFTNYMSFAERETVVFSTLSDKQKYYDEDIAEYIQEMLIFNEELNKNYIIHITLPPEYNKEKFYPMFMMTDGIWRLNDHREIRSMMINKEIEDIILVSIGYDYGVNAEIPETRLVEFVQESELFLNFITNKLAPYLGELYNIDFRRSALMGHSLGGLFMYYAVFNHNKYSNQPFKFYVMGSPSFFITEIQLYWKHGDIEREYFKVNKTLDKEIYLAAGNREFPDMQTNIQSFLHRARRYGITTIDYEIYSGDHTSYVLQMMRNSVLKFYGKEK